MTARAWAVDFCHHLSLACDSIDNGELVCLSSGFEFLTGKEATRSTNRWKAAINHCAITFEGRLVAASPDSNVLLIVLDNSPMPKTLLAAIPFTLGSPGPNAAASL